MISDLKARGVLFVEKGNFEINLVHCNRPCVRNGL